MTTTITADTLTDAQLEALRAEARDMNDHATAATAAIALGARLAEDEVNALAWVVRYRDRSQRVVDGAKGASLWLDLDPTAVAIPYASAYPSGLEARRECARILAEAGE